MPKRYRVTFGDGRTVDVEANNGDLAKKDARRQAQDQSGAETRTDPRVKVTSVEELTDDHL